MNSFLNMLSHVEQVFEKFAPETGMLNTYKRKVIKPDPDTLFWQQVYAFDDMVKFLHKAEGGMHILEGYAGTGKTHTISLFIEWVLSQPEIFGKARIAMTAPTNDAVRVLYEMGDYRDERLCFKTGHSLLGLIADHDEEGQLIFVSNKNPDEPAGIEEVEILVVDEVSQLSDEIFIRLEKYVAKGLKIIFMGDSYQIPPVGQVYSIPFLPAVETFEGGKVVEATYIHPETKEKETRKFSFTTSLLDQIVRQGEGNPIVETSIKLRKNIHRPTPLPVLETQLIDGGETGIEILSPYKLEEKLAELFLSEEAADASFVKVLAWRNTTVNDLNKTIRKLLYPGGEWKNKIAPGDKLIAKKPILQSETGAILFPNKERFEVKSFEVKERKLSGALLKYYEVKVVSSNFAGRMREEMITVVHEESEQVLKDILKGIAQTAKKRREAGDGKGAKEMWDVYHNVKNNFAEVGHNYAITAHNSQGKTLDYTIVIWKDMDYNSNVFERNRIKYTALTRAKRKVYIVK